MSLLESFYAHVTVLKDTFKISLEPYGFELEKCYSLQLHIYKMCKLALMHM